MKRFIFIAAAMLATLFAMAQGQRPQQPQMPENVAYVEYNMKMGEVEGRSYNHAPTFFIYPDTKLDEAGAKALVEEFDMKDVLTAVGGNCGGIFGGPASAFSNYSSFWADATQKRGAVEMPYCSILGTSDKVVPFYSKDNYKGNSFLNAWNTYQQMNGMEVTTDLDFSIDPLFGLELADRETITTNKGEGIKMETGFFYKDEKPLIKVIALVDYGHWNFMPAAQIMWDYFKMFSRDPQTKKLIYHGK